MSLNVAILMSALERVDDPCSVAMGKNICEIGVVESVQTLRSCEMLGAKPMKGKLK